MNHNQFSISWEVIRAGQPRPYADSIYEYKVYSESSEQRILAYCTRILRPAEHKGSNFSGSCDFPHGLSPFYAFKKIVGNTYHYIVCQPYTG